ncbi:MAG: hypothetical protein ACRDZX_04275 [Acidimicrobiales bacterium]
MPFGTALPASRDRGPDLRVSSRCDDGLAAEEEIPGHVLARRSTPSGQALYTLVRGADGYVLRMHGAADFLVDAEISEVGCRPWRDARPGIAEVLLQATVLSFVLALRGRVVLHASAVSAGGHVWALAGPSGSGKSTVAALLCAGGAALVADDLACIGPGPQLLGTGPGAELRLRGGARQVLGLFEAEPPSYETADGRLAIRPTALPDRPVSLSGILLPELTGNGRRLRAERVRGPEAVLQLLGAARIAGWRDPGQQQRFFRAMVALAREVPLWRVSVPWTSPLGAVPPAELLGALERAGGR